MDLKRTVVLVGVGARGIGVDASAKRNVQRTNQGGVPRERVGRLTWALWPLPRTGKAIDGAQGLGGPSFDGWAELEDLLTA